MMQRFMWLSSSKRDVLKWDISMYCKAYFDKVAPVFANIDEDAANAADLYLETVGSGQYNPNIGNEADIASDAHYYGISYGISMELMKYNVRLMSIATLYQFWEQQVRKFLYEELIERNHENINFKDFCTNIGTIKAEFLMCGVKLDDLPSWEKINELREFQNLVKHGDGRARKILEQARPDLFRKVNEETSAIDYHFTTLNEQVLDVSDDELTVYSEALMEFWDELPERMYVQPPQS
ncbi:hypothetical protein M5X00_13555 [Paenibacillus alvei]|uniref:hypothetical protein n=1 Tax=Paenibacillus alvei TaxID=44250 RepID=UPI000289B1AE|nr:hypothetical protein [Paenibacillus alvei]EJW13841.1 hypothetical protein PAV_109p00710 [Paenibacillus alvei DSM 29]MCY9545153.1 hypothetical protein [Paenibacillus alvei]MCY9708346.1 hypothetical protein [Paenibacillus alvei]MCY9732966.1 hypothetical protein [Paenibacillus alvei]MCY9755268.1 hypothetical protein [Paenibacillus alvei]